MSTTTTTTTIEAEIVGYDKAAHAEYSLSTAPAAALHNQFHRCAQAAAAQATGYAILCGMELQRIRSEISLGQGRPKKTDTHVTVYSEGWEKWVETNCEFGLTTAKKYIAVAEGVKGRLAQEKISKSILGLIDIAPSALADNDRATLLESVSKVTEGQTLQQLYMDFGITKKDPRDNLRKGGATHHNGRPPSKNVDADIAHDSAVEFLSLMAKWLMQGQHQLIEFNDLKHLDDQLLSAREIIKPFLKPKY